jgi:O-antigen ligase
LILVGGMIAFSLTDTYFWNRMNTLTDKEALATDTAAVARSEIWVTSIQIVRDNPLGIGPGNFPRVIGTYDPQYHRRSAHNTLVVCFAELGIHGGIVFLLMMAGSLEMLRRSAKLADATERPLETKLICYGLLVSFVTYFVTGLGTERFYCESFWWIMVLPLCLHRVVMREAAASARAPELAHQAHPAETPAFLSRLRYEF